jgi:UDP-3-O-[3-hydroxymyristoyl] N-acetylglucosamine deacetylase
VWSDREIAGVAMATNAQTLDSSTRSIERQAGSLGSADQPSLLNGNQHTLSTSFERSGIGLHSGIVSTVRVCPAAAAAGRYFVRLDLPDRPVIPATVSSVSQTVLSTELSAQQANVRTVEHLLAALSALGIDNARIEMTGAEVPLLDGSAWPWVESILQAGRVEQPEERVSRSLLAPVWLHQGDAFVAAIPAETLQFSYGIDFTARPIGTQWQSWSPEKESFAAAIAPARTFGLAEQIEQLQQQGLIKGGTLENALVCDQQQWLNPPLRFSNEPVRHKLLDLIGDLSLLGPFPCVHVLAYKASHRLHTGLAQRLAQVLSD